MRKSLVGLPFVRLGAARTPSPDVRGGSGFPVTRRRTFAQDIVS
ncbi:MAG: hypothetical protein ACKO4T_02805 [Planctomycetaceae bacterium]